eukprot:358731-Chlamydomonas_euryale.AAC.3
MAGMSFLSSQGGHSCRLQFPPAHAQANKGVFSLVDRLASIPHQSLNIGQSAHGAHDPRLVTIGREGCLVCVAKGKVPVQNKVFDKASVSNGKGPVQNKVFDKASTRPKTTTTHRLTSRLA